MRQVGFIVPNVGDLHTSWHAEEMYVDGILAEIRSEAESRGVKMPQSVAISGSRGSHAFFAYRSNAQRDVMRDVIKRHNLVEAEWGQFYYDGR